MYYWTDAIVRPDHPIAYIGKFYGALWTWLPGAPNGTSELGLPVLAESTNSENQNV
jgi:hypothetical protein